MEMPEDFGALVLMAAGATGAAMATDPPAFWISIFIASTTSPTVRVRPKAATSCASMPSFDCTSDKISTRLMESTPSSVSKSMSISSMSVSYPVFSARTSNVTDTADSVEMPISGGVVLRSILLVAPFFTARAAGSGFRLIGKVRVTAGAVYAGCRCCGAHAVAVGKA